MTRNPVAARHWRLYDRLQACVTPEHRVEQVLIGLTWTLCRSGGIGLAMSPGTPTRTLAWPGTLAGRPVEALAEWVRAWDPYQAVVGMAAINSILNADASLAASATPLFPAGPANLAVFEHFADRLAGRRVVVIGRYPGLDRLALDWNLTVLERRPEPGDLPDASAEYLLSDADWVFLTATSIPNKTFPRLAELAADAKLVLMGPTVPWTETLRDFGVDYLAGVRVEDPQALSQTVAEGGGTRIFDAGVRYAVTDLHSGEMDRLRRAIAATVARRDALKRAMTAWYESGNRGRFPGWAQLESLDRHLSDLDTRFKRCDDARARVAGGGRQGSRDGG